MGRSGATAEGPAAGLSLTAVACRRPILITCPKCGKENQDHYKFCLGCGAELPRAGAAKPFSAHTPPQGIPQQRASAPAPGVSPAAGAATVAVAPGVASRATPPASPAAQSASVSCPQCGHGNVPGNRFCASCGY